MELICQIWQIQCCSSKDAPSRSMASSPAGELHSWIQPCLVSWRSARELGADAALSWPVLLSPSVPCRFHKILLVVCVVVAVRPRKSQACVKRPGRQPGPSAYGWQETRSLFPFPAAAGLSATSLGIPFLPCPFLPPLFANAESLSSNDGGNRRDALHRVSPVEDNDGGRSVCGGWRYFWQHQCCVDGRACRRAQQLPLCACSVRPHYLDTLIILWSHWRNVHFCVRGVGVSSRKNRFCERRAGRAGSGVHCRRQAGPCRIRRRCCCGICRHQCLGRCWTLQRQSNAASSTPTSCVWQTSRAGPPSGVNS